MKNKLFLSLLLFGAHTLQCFAQETKSRDAAQTEGVAELVAQCAALTQIAAHSYYISQQTMAKIYPNRDTKVFENDIFQKYGLSEVGKSKRWMVMFSVLHGHRNLTDWMPSYFQKTTDFLINRVDGMYTQPFLQSEFFTQKILCDRFIDNVGTADTPLTRGQIVKSFEAALEQSNKEIDAKKTIYHQLDALLVALGMSYQIWVHKGRSTPYDNYRKNTNQ